MSYYPEKDSHINDKVQVQQDLSNYATKKELKDATGIDTSNSTDKKDFGVLKADLDKIDISKLLCVPTHLDNLKLKVHGLGVAKLKPILIDLKKLSDVVTKEIVKNTKFNTLKTDVNVLEKKIPDASTIFQKMVMLRVNFLMSLV